MKFREFISEEVISNGSEEYITGIKDIKIPLYTRI